MDYTQAVHGTNDARSWPSPNPISPQLGRELTGALETSAHAYVSPLRSDGSESTCHAQVWFAWIDRDVWVACERGGWRARSIARGLVRARLWVGDFGSWRLPGDPFRRAPGFDAEARFAHDAASLERFAAECDRKYRAELGLSREVLLRRVDDGSHLLVRYTPDLSTLLAA